MESMETLSKGPRDRVSMGRGESPGPERIEKEMGQAKLRGAWIDRRNQAKAREAEQAEATRKQEAILAKYIEAMTSPLVVGERVSYEMRNGVLMRIRRSGVDVPYPLEAEPSWSREHSKLAVKVNIALRVVSCDAWGNVTTKAGFTVTPEDT